MTNPDSRPGLVRQIGLTSAVFILINSIIGSAIFIIPQNVAAAVNVPGLAIGVWIFSGLLTLAGALTNAEIANEITDTGGQYVFFRVLFKDWLAFLYGWTGFVVYQTGTNAAIAVAFGRYLDYLVPLPHLSQELEAWTLPFIDSIAPLDDIGIKLAAIAAIMSLTIINYFGLKWGTLVNNVFTSLKLTAVAAIVILSFTSSEGSVENFFPLWGTPNSGSLLSAMGIAMIATLWAYEGWNNVSFVAGEVINPKRNVPLALTLGTVCIILIYTVINLAYLYVLPIDVIATSNLVASDVMEKIVGRFGGELVAAAVMISSFGCVNGTALTAGRITFAMAKDKLFFRSLGEVHPKFHTPGKSLLAQGIWTSLLTLSGTYDQLFTYVIFAGWIFYALGAGGIFILRRKTPNAQRSYHVPGYPVVPLLFIIVATWFVINTLIEQTTDSLVGLVLLLLGIPFYLYWKKNLQKETAVELPKTPE
ncbi:MAG: amino acid permease [Ignavibacteriae bacterium]|nr:amino acid permease [Ignavibacteriota bacterium]